MLRPVEFEKLAMQKRLMIKITEIQLRYGLATLAPFT